MWVPNKRCSDDLQGQGQRLWPDAPVLTEPLPPTMLDYSKDIQITGVSGPRLGSSVPAAPSFCINQDKQGEVRKF